MQHAIVPKSAIIVQDAIVAFQPNLSEMMEQVMKEVAQEARESSKKATDAYFEQMRRNIALNKANWEERINSIIND